MRVSQPAGSTAPAVTAVTAAGVAGVAVANPREAAAQSLAALLAEGEAWPAADSVRFRNLLLDACGSDHRALVELLLRVGRHGVADAIRRLGPLAPAAWPAHRTRLVSLACGELFIGAEIAGWAVDAWAVALGAIPATTADTLRREYAERERRAEAERQRLEAQAAVLARTHAALAPAAYASTGPASGAPAYIGGSGTGGVTRPLTGAGGLLATPRWGGTAAAVLAKPSWGGGGGAARVGAWRRGPGGPPRWRVSATPMPPPNMKRFFALFSVVSVCMFGVVILMRRLSPTLTVPVPLIQLPQAAPVAAMPAPSATAPSAPTATPQAATAPVAVPVATPNDTSAASPRLGTRGARAGGDSVVVGRRVRPLAPPTGVGTDFVHAGVGGVYEVEQRILSVHGNGLCDPVAESLARRQLRTLEEITHAAGDATFRLATRPGVVGTLAPDGVFTTAVHRSTHDNVRLVFRMAGRFTPDGFVARSVTETDAILRYRERQQCLVQADLIGTRRR